MSHVHKDSGLELDILVVCTNIICPTACTRFHIKLDTVMFQKVKTIQKCDTNLIIHAHIFII